MSPSDRQRIERVPGSRRARLTPAPGTGDEPAPEQGDTDPEVPPDTAGQDAEPGPAGPNDERMRRDVPPHY